MNINGLKIEYDNGKLTIEGLNRKGMGERNKEVEIDKSGNIEGDVVGNIEITGDNVTLIVKGDVTGNIVGGAEIKVEGDLVGNIVGRTVNKK